MENFSDDLALRRSAYGFVSRAVSLLVVFAYCQATVTIALAAEDNYSEHLIGAAGDGTGLSFVVGNTGKLAFSYSNEYDNSVRYGELENGAWVSEIIDSSLSLPTETALSFYSGEPHVTYINPTTNRLLYALRSNGNWIKGIIDPLSSTSGKPASQPCGTLVCVSYYDNLRKTLKFAEGFGGSWLTQDVEITSHDLGAMHQMALAPSGRPVLAYYDATSRKPKIAFRATNGTWSTEIVSLFAIEFGIWPDLAISQNGEVHLAFSGYLPAADSGSDPSLWYAKRATSGAWSIEKLEWPYVGGHIDLELDNIDLPVIAYRYRRRFLLGESGILVRRKIPASNSWEFQVVATTFNDSSTEKNIDLAFDLAGSPLVAYHAEHRTTSEIRLHGAVNVTSASSSSSLSASSLPTSSAASSSSIASSLSTSSTAVSSSSAISFSSSSAAASSSVSSAAASSTVSSSSFSASVSSSSATSSSSTNAQACTHLVSGTPLNLQGTAPESGVITINTLSRPSNTNQIALTLTVFDPDSNREGRVKINGTYAVDLFGTSGVRANNGRVITLPPLLVPASYFHLGNNTLSIEHLRKDGFRIQALAVSCL